MKLLPLFFSLALVLTAGAEAPFQGVAGLQLYSLRDLIKKDLTSALDKAKEFGVTQVELAANDLPPEQFHQQLEERGLKAISSHVQYNMLQKDLAGVIKNAKIMGVQYVVCPWIPHEEANFGAEAAKKAAQDFNTWGEAMKKEGITFGYHCHGYEFQPMGDSNAFDVLMQETKPEFVTMEMDVFWVTVPGVDPVKLLEKYPGRWQLMHLKDLRKGAPVGYYTGHAAKTDDVPLGTGIVKWPEVLRTAAKVGVKYYFIEDESPTSVEAIPKSLAYLQTLKK